MARKVPFPGERAQQCFGCVRLAGLTLEEPQMRGHLPDGTSAES